MAISKFANLSINSCTSKNKRSKQENSTGTKQDLMKQKLDLKDKIEPGGTPHMKGVGILVGNFELNP